MKAIKAVQAMSDQELQVVWDALINYNPREMYDAETTMDEWAQIVYSEMDRRGIPHFDAQQDEDEEQSLLDEMNANYYHDLGIRSRRDY